MPWLEFVKCGVIFIAVLPYAEKSQVSLANESPYLLLNRSSCRALKENIQEHAAGEKELLDIDNLLGRFRSNFIIDHAISFEEDKWKKLQIGQQVFMVGIIFALLFIVIIGFFFKQKQVQCSVSFR